MTPIEWLDEIKSAKKREKDYREDGKDILDVYENEKDTPFNILYSNTETLLPALFSQVPRPVVQRRYKDEDQLGKSVSEAAQRMLEYLVDTDLEGYDNFECSMQDAALDGLLPGRGVTSVKYESAEDVSWETVCTDSRSWDRVYFGYARKWSKVPWVAYEEYLDEEEAERLFGKEPIKDLKFTEGEETDEEPDSDKNEGKRKTIEVYQIWDKSDKTIKYVCPQEQEKFLKQDEDPLGLIGFFNCPKPIQFVKKSNNLMPTAPYKLYENQARELNKIQTRLNRVIDAIKARGVYNGELGEELEKVFKEEDNALIPTDKASALVEGGIDKNIWMLPIGELVAVAQQLIQARESAKRVIYEITGISDIVRGSSAASETLGAQKIKEAWGTMRLKRLQKEVQRYALDTMKIMLNIAVLKFNEKSWAKMTGLPFTTTEQKQEAMRLVQAAQMQMQQMAPPPGAPPPQVPPAVQQAQKALQAPHWPDILKAMQDEFSRSYRVDIETNSTLDVEATEDKQLVGDFMNAMAQFMNGMGPLIEKGVLPFGAAKSMMLSIVKRYRFGREVEEELQAMTEPKPKPNPEQEKQVKEFQKAQEDFAKQKQQTIEQFTQKKQQAEESLANEAQKIREDRKELDFEKRLAALQFQYDEKLKNVRLDMDQSEAESALKTVLSKHKSDMQRMYDKHEARVKALSGA